MRKLWGIAAVGVTLACGGGGKATRPSGGAAADSGTPPWLAEGSGAVYADAGRRLQGVGVASGIADAKRRRKAADAAAREQLQGGVDALAQALAKLGENTPPDAVTGIARRAASQVAAIRDHWVTPDGDERALGVVEMDAFKRALPTVDGDDRVKREISANLDRAFDQLAGK
jgi:hypothetical protein